MLRKVRRLPHHLYAIEFDNDVTKIGRSCHPKDRLQWLGNSHRQQGIGTRRSWVSAPLSYADALDLEYTLKVMCAERWPTAHGIEYFAGADLDDIADLVMKLTDPASTSTRYESRPGQFKRRVRRAA